MSDGTTELAAAELPVSDGSLIDHPSGFIALSKRNTRFEISGVQGFIAYREQGRHLVAFGGVHAPAQNRGQLLDAFIDEAKRRKRNVMAVQVRDPQVELFCERGFMVNQFGTSYTIDLAGYSLRGTSKMQLRNKIKRAERAGLRIVEVGKQIPRDAEAFAKLQGVSDAWLKAKKKKELDFMIGELGGPEDRERRIFLALGKNDEACAFITYVPVWGSRPGYLHDLTRRIPDAPTGAMELCNSVAIQQMCAEGVRFLHLGFTPFIVEGAEPRTARALVRWLTDKLRKYGTALYPADSQAAYKTKWGAAIREPEYITVKPFSLRAFLDFFVVTRSI